MARKIPPAEILKQGFEMLSSASLGIPLKFLIVGSAFIFLCILGCGVRPAEQTGGSVGALKLNGVVTSENEPLKDQSVILMSTGDVKPTDSQGAFSFETDPISGELWMEISGDWGSANLVIPDVSSDAAEINLEVSVDYTLQSARILSIDIRRIVTERHAAAADSVQITKQRCTSCHIFRPESRCSDPNWVILHQATFICSAAPEDDPITDTPTPTSPSGGFSSPDTINEEMPEDDKPTKPRDSNPSGCSIGCHVKRSPNCGSASWKSINSTHAGACDDDSDDKKKNKKKKDDKKQKLSTAELGDILRELSTL